MSNLNSNQNKKSTFIDMVRDLFDRLIGKQRDSRHESADAPRESVPQSAPDIDASAAPKAHMSGITAIAQEVPPDESAVVASQPKADATPASPEVEWVGPADAPKTSPDKAGDAPQVVQGIEYHDPTFPHGNTYALFNLSMNYNSILEDCNVECKSVGLEIDLNDGSLIRETSYHYDSRPGEYEKKGSREPASYAELEAMIAGAKDAKDAAFFKGMNEENWRDYVSRHFRAQNTRLKGPTRVAPSDLLDAPQAIDSLYACGIPGAYIGYFRKVQGHWRLFEYNENHSPNEAISFERDNFATRFAHEGEKVVQEIKRSVSAQGSWYDRTLTPLEAQYFLSRLQLMGLYELSRGEQMPEVQPCYRRNASRSPYRTYFANHQVWYVMDGKRWYLQNIVPHTPYPYKDNKNPDNMLRILCHETISGCVLSGDA